MPLEAPAQARCSLQQSLGTFNAKNGFDLAGDLGSNSLAELVEPLKLFGDGSVSLQNSLSTAMNLRRDLKDQYV